MGTKVSKLIGCESFSFSVPPSGAVGMAVAIGLVEEANFEEASTGMLYHLEYMRSIT